MRLCLYHILVNKTLLSELCACMQYLFNTGVIWRGFLNKSLFANKCSETLKHKQKQKKKTAHSAGLQHMTSVSFRRV